MLKNLLYKARQKGEKPGWMLKDMWDRVIVIWASEEFKKRSNAAKAARASNTGGSLHTGGSISMETHRRRMEKEKGRVVTYAEVFEDKHLKRKKDGTREWVEPRAARVYEAYQQRFEEWRQSQPDSEDGSSTQVSLNDVASIWTQMVGGAKKGRTYGLGSQYSVGRSTTLLSGDASYSQDHEEVEALRKEVEGSKEERKEDRANFNKLQSLVEKFMSGRPFGPSNGEDGGDNEF
ncbi:PREDICTED: uncharacterized protein LOC109242077 [Nicotiana attenuata]|uniref:uncharacterized protein LOC109242077 n=1 Tax=Nicotiana attenuata TaxID=49451 RepID=UPI000904703E|nr:PREDICTED: uncharacterized protein LOC109242077 [Nicotiana attenuata]